MTSLEQNFMVVSELTMVEKEDFYTLDPDDPGGETVWGLARRYSGDLPVWKLIDELKKRSDFLVALRADTRVKDQIRDTFRLRFWLSLGCEQMNSRLVSCELFDAAVNLGPWVVGMYLRFCLNGLNKDGTLYPDLELDDGVVDKKPWADAVNALCATPSNEFLLYKALNCWQGVYYLIGKEAFMVLVGQLRQHPAGTWREKFERGWFNGRVEDPNDFLRELAAYDKKLGFAS